MNLLKLLGINTKKTKTETPTVTSSGDLPVVTVPVTAIVRPSVLQLMEGALFGQACGDALGSQTEFNKGRTATTLLPTWGYQYPAFSDDTQNMLAILEALIETDPSLDSPTSVEEFMRAMSRNLIGWVNGKYGSNNRSPGGTCMGGVRELQTNGLDWRHSGSISGGKGNGAPMRSSAVGVHQYMNPEHAFALGSLTAVPTHNNVEALLAAGTVSFLVAAAIKGWDWHRSMGELMELVGNWETSVIEHTDCADQYPDWAIARLSAAYAFGMAKMEDDEFHSFNDGHTSSRAKVARQTDFKALEAVAQAVFANTKYSNYRDVVLCCANHSGDSDTTSAIAGAIAGARWGSGAIPKEWRDTVELHEKWPTYARQVYDLVNDTSTIPKTKTPALH